MINYFIKQYSFSEYLHGGIGYADMEKILLRTGFEAIAFPDHNSFSFRAKISRMMYLLKTCLTLPRGSSLVFIYPVFAKMTRMLLTLARKKGVNIICILADIDGIKDGDSRLLQENIADFKRYKKFIVHNEAMKGWLKMQVQADQIAAIEFFDFLTKEVEGDRQKDGDIVFAGNLGKSLFIEQLHLVTKESPAIRFNLYGDGYANKGSGQPGVHFKGVFKAYDLPARLEGSFGLVWDGDSIHEPGGSLGDYMRFITHHKVSLYIISGLPLIVPEMAASAALVEKYGIGITVPGLFEIAGRVGAVTEDQYRQMRLNLRPLAQKITAGQCLAGALNDLLKNTGKV